MRSIAPCHPVSRKSARSSALNTLLMSPFAWPSAMHASNGARQRTKIADSCSRNGSLCGDVSILKLPIRHPRDHSPPSSFADRAEVTAQPFRGREAVVGECGVDETGHVGKIPVDDLAREVFLRSEVIRERTRPRIRLRDAMRG
jgi:hypothetical protein